MSAFDKQVGGNHYKEMSMQPFEFIERNGLGYGVGNIIKYLCRFNKKGGIDDLEKAKHYIELMIELENKYKNKNKYTATWGWDANGSPIKDTAVLIQW